MRSAAAFAEPLSGMPALAVTHRRDGSVFARVILPLWIGACIVYAVVLGQSIAEIRFPDQDDILRLVQVRDWLNGQGWYDLVQYRINPPAGVPMHWSRLVDVPIAAAIVVLRPLIGPAAAEVGAAFIVPLLTLLALMTILARFTARNFGRGAAALACILTVVTAPISQQFQPFRIDHHGWQMVCAALLLSGLLDPRAQRGGLIAGAAMATWLTVSMEGLPFAAGALCVLGLAWVLRATALDRARLESFGAALAIISIALWLATRVTDGFAVWCDTLSVGHLTALTVAAVGIAVAVRTARRRATRFASLAMTAIGAAAVLGTVAPQCVTGAFSNLPPLVHQYWYSTIAEGLPIWRQSSAVIWGMVAFLPMTVWGLVKLARSADGQRFDWAIHAAIIVVGVAVSAMVARASGAAAVFAIPIVAFAVRRAFESARQIRASGVRIIATAGTVVLLMPGLLLLSLVPNAGQGPASAAEPVAALRACLSPQRAKVVGGIVDSLGEGRNILAPLDLGPTLIEATKLTIMASGHHRNKDAMNDAIRFWLGRPDQGRAIARAHGVNYVIHCPRVTETTIFAAAAPSGLASLLERGQAPSWLVRVDDPRLKNLGLYRVLR